MRRSTIHVFCYRQQGPHFKRTRPGPARQYKLYIIKNSRLRLYGCIFVAESIGLGSASLTWWAPKPTFSAKKTPQNSHNAVQGHSRSPILVQSKAHMQFLSVNRTNLRPIFALFTGCRGLLVRFSLADQMGSLV